MDAFKQDQTRIRGVNEDFDFNLITIYLHARYKTFVLLVIAHLLSVHTYLTKLLKNNVKSYFETYSTYTGNRKGVRL